jgi:NRPS condensation-like uncharacterized protein
VKGGASGNQDPAPTLQGGLEVEDPDGPDGATAAYAAADPSFTDPVALLRHLDLSGHFHRDGRAGRLYHAGMVSFRENVENDSLHLVVDGNRLAAHIDAVSPLEVEGEGRSRYSVRRALLHTMAGMALDVVWLLRGRQGDHSSVLNCEWLSDDARRAERQPELLNPKAAAWSVQMEARVAGRLDKPRLQAAIGMALGRPAEPLDVVDCTDDAALDAARAHLQRMVVAVTDDPPLHAQLVHHPGGDLLMLNLNHAATDSIAALAVLSAIGRAYAGHTEPGPALDFLAGRDLPVRPASPSTSVLARAGKRAVERLRDALARTGRVAADGETDEDGYGFHLVALPAETPAQVVQSERSATSRSVLMAALHLAIGEWNLEHGTPGRRIGVLMPINLRPARWRAETIGNFCVTARVSTSRRERADAAAALKAVTAQSSRNKSTRTGIALIAGLERSGLLALWAKQSTIVLQPLTGNRLVDSAVLSNLGWHDEAPSFGPDAGATTELWYSVPARSPLSLVIGAVTVDGCLHLSFRYPRRLFGPDAAARFAACFARQLRLVADARS